MKKERIKILEMVQEGTITVDEAAKLLEALKAGGDFGVRYEDAEEKLNQFARSVDDFAKDFSDRFSGVFKEVEPKLKSATKVVIEKTVSLLDDVSRSLHEAASNMEAKTEDCGCGCGCGDKAPEEEARPEEEPPREN